MPQQQSMHSHRATDQMLRNSLQKVRAFEHADSLRFSR